MKITKKPYELIHHIYCVDLEQDTPTLAQVIIEVAKMKNALRSWPGPIPDSMNKLRQLQSAIKINGESASVFVPMPIEQTLWVQFGKKPFYTIIRAVVA